MSIFVTRPYTPPLEEYLVELKRIWDDKIFTNQGRCVTELESRLKSFLDVDNIQLVSNGTIALQVALETFGRLAKNELNSQKREVITTPFTYVATTNSIIWQYYEPVFVDIEKDNFTLDPAMLEDAITKNTYAIMPVHVFGYACKVDEIQGIAKKHQVPVIYDAAHAFGSRYKGKSLLSYGDLATISFHATKLYHMAEGGGIIVNDSNLQDKVDLLKRFGHFYDDYIYPGINAKISEIQAALGLVNLNHIQEIIKARKEICESYDALLQGVVQRPKVQEDLEYNYAYYPVVFKSEDDLLKVMTKLKEHDIFPRRYFYPSLNKLPYVKPSSCPISESISSRILCLPLFVGLTAEEISKICKLIKECLV